MDALTQGVVEYIKHYNWNSPFTFIIVILIGLLILKKFSIFLLVFGTLIIGWGARDLMITHASTNKDLISIPFVVYCVGGLLFIVLSLISFYKS